MANECVPCVFGDWTLMGSLARSLAQSAYITGEECFAYDLTSLPLDIWVMLALARAQTHFIITFLIMFPSQSDRLCGARLQAWRDRAGNKLLLDSVLMEFWWRREGKKKNYNSYKHCTACLNLYKNMIFFVCFFGHGHESNVSGQIGSQWCLFDP